MVRERRLSYDSRDRPLGGAEVSGCVRGQKGPLQAAPARCQVSHRARGAGGGGAD